MESPPTYSANSEVPPLSDDSGLLITSGSFSSDSASGWPHISLELQESDCDERSLSLCESTDTSERICSINFNTVKKGPAKVPLTAIEPPPQFQDSPQTNKSKLTEISTPQLEELTPDIVLRVESVNLNIPHPRENVRRGYDEKKACIRARQTTRILHLSPCPRPASRNSLSSRRSSSHNSLVAPLTTDDSSFITQAISHHTLSQNTHPHILDMYNVPFDSDVYAVPIDMIPPSNATKHKKKNKNRKRGKNVPNCNISPKVNQRPNPEKDEINSKRHSLPGCSAVHENEPMHMTLREVRKYLHTLYSSSNDEELRNDTSEMPVATVKENCDIQTKKVKKKKHKDESKKKDTKCKVKSSPARMLSVNLKQTFCNLFRLRRGAERSAQTASPQRVDNEEEEVKRDYAAPPLPIPRRALPPLPHSPRTANAINDFATSIQKVKDYGWYWGPISVEGAEKILSGEPDGSFIVRDSSDHHYIFTLTFKLNGLRHVRIEHEQGNFCFGGCTMFKAQTIVEFIEKAVETSRSGRYLFFLNLRPVLGPVRVQLLHPVSRFKRVQSLQHMCRFVILKVVRRDLIKELPLPRRLIDYLGATHYFSELVSDS